MSDTIQSFQVIAPSSITAGEPFDITVRALDADGRVVRDTADIVSISSEDPYMTFALEGSDTFTKEIQTPFVRGEATLRGLDSKEESFTLFVEDNEQVTGQKTIFFDFTTLRVTFLETDPPPGTGTLEHYRFFEERIDVDTIPSPLSPAQEGMTRDFTHFGDPALRVSVVGED